MDQSPSKVRRSTEEENFSDDEEDEEESEMDDDPPMGQVDDQSPPPQVRRPAEEEKFFDDPPRQGVDASKQARVMDSLYETKAGKKRKAADQEDDDMMSAGEEETLAASMQLQEMEDIINKMWEEENKDVVETWAKQHWPFMTQTMTLEEKRVLWRMNYAMEQVDKLQRLKDGDRSYFKYDILPGDHDPWGALKLSEDQKEKGDFIDVDFEEEIPKGPQTRRKGQKGRPPSKTQEQRQAEWDEQVRKWKASHDSSQPLFYLRLKVKESTTKFVEEHGDLNVQMAMMWDELMPDAKVTPPDIRRNLTVIPIYHEGDKKNVDRLIAEQKTRNRAIRFVQWFYDKDVDLLIKLAIMHAEMAGGATFQKRSGETVVAELKTYMRPEVMPETEVGGIPQVRKKKPGRKPLPPWKKKDRKDMPHYLEKRKKWAEWHENMKKRREDREKQKEAEQIQKAYSKLMNM